MQCYKVAMNTTHEPSRTLVNAGGLMLCLWHCPAPKARHRLLFLHGYYDTGRSFDTIIHELGMDFECWCLDFRGHGQSASVGPGGSYHLLDYAKDTVAALQYLAKHDSQVDVLVGHSMGGNIALMVAGALPESVKGLVLLDSMGAPSEDENEAPERLGQTLKAAFKIYPAHTCASVDEAIAKLRANNSDLSLEGAKRMATHMLYPDPANPNQFVFAFDPRMRGPTPFRFSEGAWRAYCERVAGPTLVLRAERGYLPDEGEYAERLSAFSNAKLVLVPNVGHHLHVDAPKTVAEHLNAYFSEHFSGI
jgi:pimeloyl-ACP methyl ester carboxylesterase